MGLERPEEVSFRARHVLVLSEEMGDVVLQRAKEEGGVAAMEAMAPLLSMCTLSKENGGDLGWHTPGDFPFADISDIVAKLKPSSGE